MEGVRRERAGEEGASIGRPVVDEDDLHSLDTLRGDARDRLGEIAFAVPERNDDADEMGRRDGHSQVRRRSRRRRSRHPSKRYDQLASLAAIAENHRMRREALAGEPRTMDEKSAGSDRATADLA